MTGNRQLFGHQQKLTSDSNIIMMPPLMMMMMMMTINGNFIITDRLTETGVCSDILNEKKYNYENDTLQHGGGLNIS